MKCTLVALELAGEVVEAAAKQCLWSVKHESSERISSKSDVPRECSGEEKMEGSISSCNSVRKCFAFRPPVFAF